MYNPKRKTEEMRKKSSLHFMVGLSISLGITLMAFNYTSSEVVNKIREVEVDGFEEDYVLELFTIEKPKPQTPLPNPSPIVTPTFTDDFVIDDTPYDEPTIPDDGSMDDEPILPYNPVDIPQKTEGSDVFVFVEEMPLFPGGEAAMMKFLAENLRYPEWALENRVQGKITIQFIVDENGNVVNAEVISKKLGYGCDEAALEVINSMPRWKPGKQRSKNVKVRFVVPITFKIG